jgi:CDP-diacylglycerol--glycerol-3-phosphate 3-phosphatidyltransferase
VTTTTTRTAALLQEPLTTVANLVTAVRTFAGVGLGLGGLASHDLRVLAAAYAVYWIGDVADGWTARRRGEETRVGAVFDIVGDRACTAVIGVGVLGLGVLDVSSVWPVALTFLVSFLVVDTMLSLAFLCWPLRSPNDFHLVDRPVWRWNWSPLAKATNTAGVVVAVAVGQPFLALLLALTVLGVKVWSLHRVARMLLG